jgi:protease-4
LRAARVLVTLGLFFLLLLALTRGRSGKLGALSGVFGGDAIGVVEIDGTITDSKDTIKELKRYGKTHFVKAIILRIESPGGGVASSQEIYEEIGKLKKKKPVIASLAGVAASGGY